MQTNKAIGKIWLKMSVSYFLKNRLRLVAILLSIIIGASTVAALSSVYLDINSKMRNELRAYGPNLIITKEKDQEDHLNESDLGELKKLFNPHNLHGYSPFLFGNAEMGENRVAVVGTDLREFRKISPQFRNISTVKNTSANLKNTAYVGRLLAEKMAITAGQKIKLTDNKAGGNTTELHVVSIIETGDVEDEQIITGLRIAQKMFDKQNKVDLLKLSSSEIFDDLKGLEVKINKISPETMLFAINKISKSEGLILDKIRLLVLFVSSIILISSIFATSVILSAMVHERRYELGIKKAIGAADRIILKELLGEGILAGIIGGLCGWLLGIIIAQLIGYTVFGSPISLRFITIIFTIATSVAITVIPSILPLRKALKIEPATVLRTE